MSNCRIEAKRTKALKATPVQKLAWQKLMNHGEKGLTKEDMAVLSTYTALTISQRNVWAAKAAA